jgi:hypothetical protein
MSENNEETNTVIDTLDKDLYRTLKIELIQLLRQQTTENNLMQGVGSHRVSVTMSTFSCDLTDNVRIQYHLQYHPENHQSTNHA